MLCFTSLKKTGILKLRFRFTNVRGPNRELLLIVTKQNLWVGNNNRHQISRLRRSFFDGINKIYMISLYFLILTILFILSKKRKFLCNEVIFDRALILI